MMNHAVDIVLLLCMGWGAYKGFRKGFIIQSFTILALFLAIWGGFAFTGKIEPLMKNHFQMPEATCYFISFVIVFLLIMLLVYFSGFLISKVVSFMALGMINRLSGAAFGLFANALVLSVLMLLFDRVNEKKRYIPSETLTSTRLYEPVGKLAPAVLPEKFFRKILK